MTRRGEPGIVSRLPGSMGFFQGAVRTRRSGLVSIIVPTRDMGGFLDRCLLSVFERTAINFEVVVVDNGSRDPAVLRCSKNGRRARASPFRWITHDIPFNYASLINAGVAASGGKYVLLLNDDTEVITADWLETMMAHAQRPAIGASAPSCSTASTPSSTPASSSASWARLATPSVMPPPISRLFRTRQHGAQRAGGHGGVPDVPARVYDQVGGLDEAFDSAYNDVDFCLRLHKLGLRHVYVPEAKLYHAES